MNSVGSQLRQARVSLGVTLEQIAAKTRISTKNLEAIENDELSRISSPFFYRSFVRQFAEFLKLDYGALSATVDQAARAIPEPRMPGEDTVAQHNTKQVKVAALKVHRPRNLRWLYSLLSFVIVLIACSSFYGAWEQSRSDWRGTLNALISFILPGHSTPAHSAHQTAAQLGPGLPDSATPDARPESQNR